MRNVTWFFILVLAGCAVASAQDGRVICEPGAERGCFSGMCGVCAAGKQVCLDEGTRWGACLPEYFDRVEVCGNSRDDDCDCGIDERCR